MSEFASANLTAGQLNALVKKIGGEEKVLDILRGVLEVVVTVAKLLARLPTTAPVKAVKEFVAEKFFTEENHIYVWDDFRRIFWEKTEKDVKDDAVVAHRLEKDSTLKLILQELGDKAEITLAHLYDLLQKQLKGEDGPLLTNSWANIFFIRDANGKLWAVDCRWDSGDRKWRVAAYSVAYSYVWRAGYRVFSRELS